MLCNVWAVTTYFFSHNIFDGFREHLLLTKVALIPLLNHATIHWCLSLSRKWALEQFHMFQIEACAKLNI